MPFKPLICVLSASVALAGCTYNTGMPIRTASGATVSSDIGARMAQQERDLNQQLVNSGTRVTNTGSQLRVIVPENVAFVTGSAMVEPGIRPALREVARSLRAYPDSNVRVVGHTDTEGSESFNRQLSQDRALAVANILVAEGVRFTRVTASGHGSAEPITSNATAAGRAQNRRVEIVITPIN